MSKPDLPFEETPKRLINLARAFRRRRTSAEGVLWGLVRSRRMGVKFRRQHPIEPFVLDFYCHELRLAVELDGSQHTAPAQRIGDDRRTAALAARGIQVLRFSNLEILQETQAVAETLWQACQQRLTTTDRRPRQGSRGSSPCPGGETEPGPSLPRVSAVRHGNP